MASIQIVGDDVALMQLQEKLLIDAGHQIEIAPDMFQAQERLSGPPCDFVLIDVGSPDGGMALLIEQARAAWEGCRIIAMLRHSDQQRSKVHEMGLWTPDRELIHPVEPDELLRALN